MQVASNECVFRELEDYYIEPAGDQFVLTIENMDEEWKPWTVPCTKDAHTLFQIEYTGGPGEPDLISSSWKIYEDQSKLLSQCAAVCPSLKSAMTSYPEATIDMFLPQDIPTEPDMMSTACSIRYCLSAEVACKSLTLHWPALDIPIRNLQCPCACKSSFTKPSCLHVDVCAPGNCDAHVKSVWACAKTKKDACSGVVAQFTNSPKILECVEGKDLPLISDPRKAPESDSVEVSDAQDSSNDAAKSDETRLFSLGDIFQSARNLPPSTPFVKRQRYSVQDSASIISMVAGAVLVTTTLVLISFVLRARASRQHELSVLEDFSEMTVE